MRGTMRLHHRSARVWATAALLSVLLPSTARLGWWLPLHLFLAGTASQLIVGGQIYFSAALGMTRPIDPRVSLGQLAGLNVGAGLLLTGRLAGSHGLLVAGGTTFALSCIWAGTTVERLWRRSVQRRFAVTRMFYGLATASIVLGALLGIALGAGLIGGRAYASHRLAHMVFNLFGWAVFTILGTMVSLLPTILRVRTATAPPTGRVPAVAFAGLLVVATGLTLDVHMLAATGGGLFLATLVIYGRSVADVAKKHRRHPVPVAGRHLLAAMGWLGIVGIAQIPLLARGDGPALRDVWIVGIAGGVVVQAVLGSWAFLLPMERRTTPHEKRALLSAFEVFGRTQVLLYNAGLLLTLTGLRGLSGPTAGAVGIAFVWSATAMGVAKAWVFPSLARLPWVRALSMEWWSERDVTDRQGEVTYHKKIDECHGHDGSSAREGALP